MQAVVTRNAGRLIFGAALVLVLVGVLMVALISAIFEQQQQQNCAGGGGGVVGGPPTKAAENAIPAGLLVIYRGAEQRFGVPWNVLAAINRIETGFGRNMSTSSAGAIGWMQFLPSTWARYAVDGDDDGKRDPYNPADAIFTAAKYLKASGSDHDLHDAIFARYSLKWDIASASGSRSASVSRLCAAFRPLVRGRSAKRCRVVGAAPAFASKRKRDYPSFGSSLRPLIIQGGSESGIDAMRRECHV